MSKVHRINETIKAVAMIKFLIFLFIIKPSFKWFLVALKTIKEGLKKSKKRDVTLVTLFVSLIIF